MCLYFGEWDWELRRLSPPCCLMRGDSRSHWKAHKMPASRRLREHLLSDRAVVPPVWVHVRTGGMIGTVELLQWQAGWCEGTKAFFLFFYWALWESNKDWNISTNIEMVSIKLCINAAQRMNPVDFSNSLRLFHAMSKLAFLFFSEPSQQATNGKMMDIWGHQRIK